MDIKNERFLDTRYLHAFAELYKNFRVQEVDILTERRGINELVGLGFDREVAKALSKAYAGQLGEIVRSIDAFTHLIVDENADIAVSTSGSSDGTPEVYLQLQPSGPFELKFGVHISYMGRVSPGYETPELVMPLLLDDDPVDADTVDIESFHPRPDSIFHPEALEFIKDYVAQRGVGRTNNFSLSNAPGGGRLISITTTDVVLEGEYYFLFSHRFSFDPSSVVARDNVVLEGVVVQPSFFTCESFNKPYNL